MTPSPIADASARLTRLQGYLSQDPDNPGLLAQACDTAIAAGEHAAALAMIDHAQRLQPGAKEWIFRRAQLAIAMRELPLAAQLLMQLQDDMGEHPVLAHDLAWVRWLEGDLDACRALLHPWLQACAPAHLSQPQRSALQVLWLRASHQLGRVQEAWAWIAAQREADTLCADAQGIASLIAIDADRFEEAGALADAALASSPDSPEALVARASVALAQRDIPRARRLLEDALHLRGDDGRIWSTLGYASLQAGDLSAATMQLRRALDTMPGHIGTWHALGWSLLLQQEHGLALQAFDRALALDPNFAESHGALGLVLALAGERSRALHHLQVCDKLDPRNVTGRYARALLAGEASDTVQLAQLARRLLDRPGFFGGKLSDWAAFSVGATVE